MKFSMNKRTVVISSNTNMTDKAKVRYTFATLMGYLNNDNTYDYSEMVKVMGSKGYGFSCIVPTGFTQHRVRQMYNNAKDCANILISERKVPCNYGFLELAIELAEELKEKNKQAQLRCLTHKAIPVTVSSTPLLVAQSVMQDMPLMAQLEPTLVIEEKYSVIEPSKATDSLEDALKKSHEHPSMVLEESLKTTVTKGPNMELVDTVNLTKKSWYSRVKSWFTSL